MNQNEKVKITIKNIVYPLKTELTELEINEIKTYVENKLKEISEISGMQEDSQKNAILTCLNISDELYRLKSNYDNLNRTIQNKIDEMIELIDLTLQKSSLKE